MGVIINLNPKIKKFINVKNFRLRFISTLFLLSAFSIVYFIGNPVLPIFLIFIFVAVLYEFNLICHNRLKLFHWIKIFIFPILLFIFLISEIYNFSSLIDNLSNYFTSLLIALIINCVFFNNYKSILDFIMSNLLIISFFSLIKLLLIPDGLNVFLYLVLLVSVMDIFAYIGGNIFGLKKIAPNISQGKTIEGTLIGMFCATLVSVLIRELIDLNIFQALLLGFAISVFAFLGDLLESFFKRKIGIKDSSKLIPGHGGLLDRFDGYILILPSFNLTLVI
jgi:phosphatidate cytidylyltransferase